MNLNPLNNNNNTGAPPSAKCRRTDSVHSPGTSTLLPTTTTEQTTKQPPLTVPLPPTNDICSICTETNKPTTHYGQQMTTEYGPAFQYTLQAPPSLDIDSDGNIKIRGVLINVLATFNSSNLNTSCCLYRLNASFIGVGRNQSVHAMLEAVDYPNQMIRVRYKNQSIEVLPLVCLSQIIYLPLSPPDLDAFQDVHQYAMVWHGIVLQRVFLNSNHRCPLRLMPALRMLDHQWQSGCFIGLENESHARGQSLEQYVLETHAYNKRTRFADTEITRLCTLMVQKRDENARNGSFYRMNV